MSFEERKEAYQKICDDFLPRMAMNTDIEEEEWLPLSVQELIAILVNANRALKEKAFSYSEEAEKKFVKERNALIERIIYRVKTAKQLFTVTDKATKLPFVEPSMGLVNVFTEEEIANDYVKHYEKMYRSFQVSPIQTENLNGFFAAAFYYNGAVGILVDNGYCSFRAIAGQILPPPNFAGLNPVSVPVLNAPFNAAVIQFLQELRWKAGYEGKEENLKKFEEAWMHGIAKTRFLVPMGGLQDLPKTPDGKITLTKGTQIKVPMLTRKQDEKKALPVFTDWNQFKLLYPDSKEWAGNVVPFEGLSFFGADTMLINPGTYCFEITPEILEKVKGMLHGEKKNG